MSAPCPLDPSGPPCRCGPDSVRCRPERPRPMWNPDCKGPCDCPGTERADPAPETFETVAKALAGAWAWGYAVAQRDALERPYSDTPEAALWKPTPNPYGGSADCATHAPVQHRDRKRPWCNSCGRAADGELIGRPRG